MTETPTTPAAERPSYRPGNHWAAVTQLRPVERESPPQITAVTAESIIVSLSAARQVGPDAAIVLGAIRAGLTSYAEIARATRMRRIDVRVSCNLLRRKGYDVPDHWTALGAAASAPVGDDTNN